MTEVEKSINDLSLTVNTNTRDIEDIRKEIDDIKDKQNAIYKLSTSVELIAQNMTNMKEDITSLKTGQDNLSVTLTGKVQELENHITVVENVPFKRTQTKVDTLQEKIMWLVVGGIISGILYLLIPFFHG